MTNCTSNAHQSKSISRIIWENLQLLVLMLTIAGQLFVGVAFFIGQGLWCGANLIAVMRDFALGRPLADVVKDSVMLIITVSLITLRLLGLY